MRQTCNVKYEFQYIYPKYVQEYICVVFILNTLNLNVFIKLYTYTYIDVKCFSSLLLILYTAEKALNSYLTVILFEIYS